MSDSNQQSSVVVSNTIETQQPIQNDTQTTSTIRENHNETSNAGTTLPASNDQLLRVTSESKNPNETTTSSHATPLFRPKQIIT
jgi:hypothetical protein